MVNCIFENADTLESDIHFEHAKYILNTEDVFSYFTEKEGESIFAKFLAAIKQAFAAVRKKVIEIFTGKKADAAAAKLEAAIAANPKLANSKVECPDYKDLHKLSADTLKKLKDPNADPEKVMEEYNKKRKGLLAKIGIGAGAIVGTTITIALLLKRLRGKKYSETMKDIDALESSGVKGIAALNARNQKVTPALGSSKNIKGIVNKKKPTLAIAAGLPRISDPTCGKADSARSFSNPTAAATAMVTVTKNASGDIIAESQANVKAVSSALQAFTDTINGRHTVYNGPLGDSAVKRERERNNDIRKRRNDKHLSDFQAILDGINK